MFCIGLTGLSARLSRLSPARSNRQSPVRTAMARPPRMLGAFRRTGTTLIRRLSRSMSNPMSALAWVCYASVAVPLAVAAWANRRTSLLHTIFWTWLAWLVWGLALSAADRRLDYVALCLTGCAGIAVFGARRPGVAAWNFVV